MRALLRTDRADDALARALAQAGLYVERVPADEAKARSALPDVAVIDPRLLGGEAPALPCEAAPPPGEGASLEELCYLRLVALLDRLQGGTLPALFSTVMEQTERALLRIALERSDGISAAAEMLGIHRNTLSRRLADLGLRTAKAAQAHTFRSQGARSQGPRAQGGAAEKPSRAVRSGAARGSAKPSPGGKRRKPE
ncbi:helix-turn-helix domain-containing protein [Vulgatibacter incomptus]|uniref:DNA binding HTH domain-containing protein n=1 Tax=Vulgatibacter incomptus TaxID=1391653 RepID=A0A0K1PA35_9BACT|nr:helix-turn-helix domain-containing protein [Vulgatibacter incomptus]AKU89979.1 hypothetical protein AKJ08_0366 [Vulgatibacter incomptus]